MKNGASNFMYLMFLLSSPGFRRTASGPRNRTFLSPPTRPAHPTFYQKRCNNLVAIFCAKSALSLGIGCGAPYQ
jgi:hypothetical protein